MFGLVSVSCYARRAHDYLILLGKYVSPMMLAGYRQCGIDEYMDSFRRPR